MCSFVHTFHNLTDKFQAGKARSVYKYEGSKEATEGKLTRLISRFNFYSSFFDGVQERGGTIGGYI